MKMLVGYQGRDEAEVEITMISPGVGERACIGCNGTGVFEGPDFKEQCVECKGTGKRRVSAWMPYTSVG